MVLFSLHVQATENLLPPNMCSMFLLIPAVFVLIPKILALCTFLKRKTVATSQTFFFCHWLVIGRILYLSYEAKIHLKIIAECEF